MRIGYLHIGAPQHGISRYGRLLAAEAHTRSHLQVLEAEVILTGDRSHDRTALIRAAQTLSQADVVHFQYNQSIWGEQWNQLDHLNAFLDQCSSPLVVTLHDIFYPPSSATLARNYFSKPQSVRFPELFKAVLRDQASPKIIALKKVIARSQLALVCTQEEAHRLSDRFTTPKIKIVPHFVESRNVQMSRTKAREALSLEGSTVITLLGFIYSGKGHELLVQALSQLPETVQLVFAGGVSSGHEAYYQELITLADKEGVRDRIRVTGYLSEAELETYLIATDLAVCPFRKTSASGSLSTWISVGRPVLASQLPQVEEYNQLQPGAIETFSPYTTDALLQAIQTQLLTLDRDPDRASSFKIAKLRQQLLISNIFDQHLNYYQSICSNSYQGVQLV